MAKPGLIHEKLDIKILILYILKRLPSEVDAATLCDLVNCDDGIDYFDYTECLEDLVRTKHINEKYGFYSITAKGINNADSVESSLPLMIRNKADKNIRPVSERLMRMAMISAEHAEENNNLYISLGMSDGAGEIIKMKCLVPNEQYAEEIEKNFRLHAEELYQQILKLLQGESEN